METSIQRKKRQFVPDELTVNSWNDVEHYYSKLLEINFSSKDDLLQWMHNRSELDAIVDEEYRWRYIHQTCDTENETYKQAYENFIQDIMPNWMNISNQLNKKLADSSYLKKFTSSAKII